MLNFRECANEGDSMERVTDPYHRKAVGKSRHQVWGGITSEPNALIEIVDGFPEPQADNQERGDTCRSLHQRQVVEKKVFRRHTDHETKHTDPSAGPLDHGFIKRCPQLGAEFGTEGDQAEQDEEDGREKHMRRQ